MVDYGTCPMGYSGYLSGWWLIGSLIVLIILFAALYLLLRQSGSKGGKREEETPLSILGRRYAKGEMSKKEYQDMSSDLRKEK
jgi:putative membrane protein